MIKNKNRVLIFVVVLAFGNVFLFQNCSKKSSKSDSSASPPSPVAATTRLEPIVLSKPISSLEKLKGSMGIMSDDIVAGVYANIILQVVYILNLLCRH